MKTKPAAKAVVTTFDDDMGIVGVFTPCPTRKEAEERKRWENRSYNDKFVVLFNIIDESATVTEATRAVLARMGVRP